MPTGDTPCASFCTVPECELETRQGRRYCEMHEKRHQRCRCTAPCQCLTAPKAERLSPQQRLLEAAIAVADADAEDDAEYQRAKRNLLHAARLSAPAAMGELIRQGMAEARKRGVRLGRPLAVSPEQARALVKRLGTVTLAAKALGVSRAAVRRALASGAETVIPGQDVRGEARHEMSPSTRAMLDKAGPVALAALHRAIGEMVSRKMSKAARDHARLGA